MGKLSFMLLTTGIMLMLPTVAKPQKTRTAERSVNRTTNKSTSGVPEEFTGSWVCQTGVAGQTMIHSSVNVITGTYESTTTTTPPGAVAMKFNLSADGTYEAPNAKGHYSFDPATKAITWLDGLHQEQITKTQIEKRSNGAPSMHFQMLDRYWGCFKPDKNFSVKSNGTTATRAGSVTPKPPEGAAKPVLAHPDAPAYSAPIVNEVVAQLAREEAAIRIRGVPDLAQIALLTVASRRGRPPQNLREEPNENEVSTRFLRGGSWFLPWGWANDISKRVPWDDPAAPAGSGFARQEQARQRLTKVFTQCLDYYEQQANVELYKTNDLAVTYAHSVALNTEISTGRKVTAQEELTLRENLRVKLSYYPYYFTDGSKQSAHEALVITTILTQAGYADAALKHDQRTQALFQETARRNVETLKNASIDDLVHAGWGPGN